jgi:hypothetical protein
MDLVFFFGAGVSVPSGLPTAADVTHALLSVDADGQNAEQVLLLQSFYELYADQMSQQGMFLVGEDVSATGPAFKSVYATYEDIHSICSEIGFWELSLSESPMPYSFLKSLLTRIPSMADNRSEQRKLFDLCQKGNLLCDYIKLRLIKLLKKPYLKGFEAVGELTRRPDVRGISIFTLNHDTLLEEFLTHEGVPYSDGFEKIDGNVRWQNTSIYEKNGNKVDIYKLHGAVDWYRFRRNGKLEIGIACKNDIGALQDASGVKISPIRKLPWFLTGKDKSAMYHYGIMNDLFFRFAKKLQRTSTLIMSGYGWGDFTINSFIQGWLDSSNDKCLVLLHRDVNVLLNGSPTFAESYRGWEKKGQVKVIPNWLSEVTAAEIINSIR